MNQAAVLQQWWDSLDELSQQRMRRLRGTGALPVEVARELRRLGVTVMPLPAVEGKRHLYAQPTALQDLLR